jgi:PadR family transcriptional regulator PadR
MPTGDDSVDIDNWTTQLRKGLLELCIVNLLAKGELYGYDLVKQLAQIRGLVVTEGTIYPLLSRLRKMGLVTTRLVESPSGPARRYYVLTPNGKRLRATMNTYWGELMRGIEQLLEESEADHG